MSDDLYIAGIGFSAGGLDPLRELFDCTLHDSVTYVIVQHLPVNYRSKLADILERHSSLKILEVEEGMMVRRDAIYVTPASPYIQIHHGRFTVEPRRLSKPFPNKSVDKFFVSLAKEKKQKSIGIILSGGGDDGLEGSRLIKQAGGIVIAQDPNNAAHPSMPKAVINEGVAEYIATASKIPEIVREHVQRREGKQQQHMQ